VNILKIYALAITIYYFSNLRRSTLSKEEVD